MPQASDALRNLMTSWFGEHTDHGATRFLSNRGWTIDAGWCWHPPVPSLRPTDEELACLQYLLHEWDYDYVIASYAYSEHNLIKKKEAL
jgi:hypothetical protein